jgi:hypothetical protein
MTSDDIYQAALRDRRTHITPEYIRRAAQTTYLQAELILQRMINEFQIKPERTRAGYAVVGAVATAPSTGKPPANPDLEPTGIPGAFRRKGVVDRDGGRGKIESGAGKRKKN